LLADPLFATKWPMTGPFRISAERSLRTVEDEPSSMEALSGA